MITIGETRDKIAADPEAWKLPFYDFVDDFRYHREMSALDDGFTGYDGQFDALLASTVEALCCEIGKDPPAWTGRVAAAEKPFFVSGLENLKATALVESPLTFRKRKVFVTSSFLQRT
jgi:hypothetical protein